MEPADSIVPVQNRGANHQMTDQTEISSGEEILRPRARILRTLGDELISSEAVAVVELVKNSYDADATRVLVRFNDPLDIRILFSVSLEAITTAVNSELINALDAGQIPDQLRQRFESKQISLPRSARAVTQEASKKWQISIGGKDYSVIKENQALNVYEIGSIEVMDDGHGMSLETIRSAWMEPATLVKRDQPQSEEKKRRVLGEKGIGRFATSRLADSLDVITRRAGMPCETQVVFNWAAFDNANQYLDEIKVSWKEVSPVEICSDGTVEALWAMDQVDPEPENLTHGTILRMKSLRLSWEKEQFEYLRNSLSRLVSPFFYEDMQSQRDRFQIFLQLPDSFEDLSGLVEPPGAIKNPHYTLKGDVEKTGHYALEVALRGQKTPESVRGKVFLKNNRRPQCGPFHIELRVWDRDQTSMAQLARAYNSTLKSVRADLNDAAGISIYRDGFRIFPYGEPLNDWLRLDLRRVNNPTLHLSNNQIVGYVLISSDENPELRDQSNREGIVEGLALNDLRELVKYVLSELETRRYALRPRKEKTPAGGVFVDFNLQALARLIREKYPDDTELIALVGEKEQDLEQRVERVQEVVARYRRLATLGQLIDTVLHDGRSPLTKIRNVTQDGLRAIKYARTSYDTLIQKLNRHYETIDIQSDALATVFNRIEPFGGRKRGRPKQVRLEKVIVNAFAVLSTKIDKINPKITLPETETWVTVDQAEIQQVVINLLDNSLYWLERIPQDQREIVVQIQRKSQEEVEILFSDNGPGVDPRFREYIFEPYFSTKPDGVGLGLTIAGEIVSDYYAGNLELLESEHLAGATFRVTLHRRVSNA
jgi:signal transduction histidine kinase